MDKRVGGRQNCVIPLTRAIPDRIRGGLWRCVTLIDAYFTLLSSSSNSSIFQVWYVLFTHYQHTSQENHAWNYKAWHNVLYGSITRKWKRSDNDTMPCTLCSPSTITNRWDWTIDRVTTHQYGAQQQELEASTHKNAKIYCFVTHDLDLLIHNKLDSVTHSRTFLCQVWWFPKNPELILVYRQSARRWL